MTRQSDLLPWILGALLIATVAIAITAGSMQGAPTPPAAAAVAAVPVPAPSAEPAVAAAVAAPAAPAVLAEAPEQALPPPLERSGQIWECTTNGIKTFSNNPCGEKSSLREVGPINTMIPTPMAQYLRASLPDPRYAPAYGGESAYADQDAYTDSASAESGGNSYAVIRGFAFPRKRAEHPHRPYHHNPGMPLRKN